MEGLRKWLNSLDLENYAAKFEEEDYKDLKLIKNLNNDEFNEMISKIGLTSNEADILRESLDKIEKVQVHHEFLSGDTAEMENERTDESSRSQSRSSESSSDYSGECHPIDDDYEDDYDDDYYEANKVKKPLGGCFDEGDIHVQWGGSGMQGWREHMEDRMAAYRSGPYAVFIVFDGHNGESCADYAHRVMPAFLCKHFVKHGAVNENIIKKTFIQFNRNVPSDSGSTATVVVVDSTLRQIHIAHIGDSRGVVFTTSKKILYTTRDHNPGNEVEKDRLLNQAHLVEIKENEMNVNRAYPAFCLLDSRMINSEFDDTNVSRAFGDGNFRINDAPEEEQPMSCIPEYFCISFDSAFDKQGEERFDDPDHTLCIFLASDGIWNSRLRAPKGDPPEYQDQEPFPEFLSSIIGVEEAKELLRSQQKEKLMPYFKLFATKRVFMKCHDERADCAYRGDDINHDVVNYCINKIVKLSSDLNTEEHGQYLMNLEEGPPVVSIDQITLDENSEKPDLDRPASILKTPNGVHATSDKNVAMLGSVQFFPARESINSDCSQTNEESKSIRRYVSKVGTLLDQLIADDDNDPNGKSTDNMTAMLLTISWQNTPKEEIKEKNNDKFEELREKVKQLTLEKMKDKKLLTEQNAIIDALQFEKEKLENQTLDLQQQVIQRKKLVAEGLKAMTEQISRSQKEQELFKKQEERKQEKLKKEIEEMRQKNLKEKKEYEKINSNKTEVPIPKSNDNAEEEKKYKNERLLHSEIPLNHSSSNPVYIDGWEFSSTMNKKRRRDCKRCTFQ